MEIPDLGSEENFVENGPAFFFQYHPALGPLYRDIAKKIEQEMSYPGTIKITVMREIKAVGVAR